MFEATLIIDAHLLVAFLIAFLAGMLSFLSPCVLPIVPSYLAYMSGVSFGQIKQTARWHVLVTAIFFVLGLSTVFVLQGAAFSTLGAYYFDYQEALQTGAALLIMVFGAHFIGVFRFSFMDRDLRFEGGQKQASYGGAYMMGLAFAFGWTPCIGPILASILSLATSEANVFRGSLLLGVYALGLGIPFLLVAVFFTQSKGFIGWMTRHLSRIERISGLLLWTIGLLMFTGQFSRLSFWLLETVPVFAAFG